MSQMQPELSKDLFYCVHVIEVWDSRAYRTWCHLVAIFLIPSQTLSRFLRFLKSWCLFYLYVPLVCSYYNIQRILESRKTREWIDWMVSTADYKPTTNLDWFIITVALEVGSAQLSDLLVQMMLGRAAVVWELDSAEALSMALAWLVMVLGSDRELCQIASDLFHVFSLCAWASPSLAAGL